jgi:tetratricopeptide (TPR) repeat protein
MSRKSPKEYTSNTEAYLLYMKGRYCWNKRTVPDLSKAIEFFQRATELDPNYALAFAGLADAYSLLGNYGGGPSTELQPKALTAGAKSVVDG